MAHEARKFRPLARSSHHSAIGVKVRRTTPIPAEGLKPQQDWGLIISDVLPERPANAPHPALGATLPGKELELGHTGQFHKVRSNYRWALFPHGRGLRFGWTRCPAENDGLGSVAPVISGQNRGPGPRNAAPVSDNRE